MMFDDRIEVTSPGGLPTGLSKEEYLEGNISVLRNPILGNILYRLSIVETLGTGILRIKEAYTNSTRKPKFEIFENTIKVTLPITSKLNLTDDETLVYNVLSRVTPKSTGEITKQVPFGKSKTTVLLKKLVEKNYISVTGNGKSTKYKI